MNELWAGPAGLGEKRRREPELQTPGHAAEPSHQQARGGRALGSASTVCCPVCSVSLGSLDATARQAHVNACLDGSPSGAADRNPQQELGAGGRSAKAAAPSSAGAASAGPCACAVCGLDLAPLPLAARLEHANRCCDALRDAPPKPAAGPREEAAASGDSSSQPSKKQAPGQQPPGPPGGPRWLPGSSKPEPGPADGMRRGSYRCAACGKDLSAATFMARVGHVKKCRGANNKEAAAPPLMEPLRPQQQCSLRRGAEGRGARPGPPLQEGEEEGRWAPEAWLSGLGLSKYAPALRAALMEESAAGGVPLQGRLGALTDDRLVAAGVAALGARRKILAAAAEAGAGAGAAAARRCGGSSAGGQAPDQAPGSRCSAPAPSSPSSAAPSLLPSPPAAHQQASQQLTPPFSHRSRAPLLPCVQMVRRGEGASLWSVAASASSAWPSSAGAAVTGANGAGGRAQGCGEGAIREPDAAPGARRGRFPGADKGPYPGDGRASDAAARVRRLKAELHDTERRAESLRKALREAEAALSREVAAAQT